MTKALRNRFKFKGFTLIELLAIIAILAIILVIAIPKILNTVDNAKQSAYLAQIELIKGATIKYLVQEEVDVDALGGSVDISLADLIAANLMPSIIKNPLTGENFDPNITTVNVSLDGNGQYVLTLKVVTPELCFTFNAGTGTITDYAYTNESCPSAVIIPATIGGVNVIAIGSSAFQSSALTDVTFPNVPLSIGSYSFQSNNLTHLTVPSTITSIATQAFSNNNFTDGVVWNADLATVASWDYAIFKSSTISEVTIGNAVTRIPNNFLSTANLTSKTITFPSSVTSIGSYSFYGSGLNRITIPSTITSIATKAFSSNNFTNGVIWNASMASVGSWDYAIFSSSTVANITFSETLTRIPANLLSASNLTNGAITIPDTVNTIGSRAFYAAEVTSVTIPASVTTVGQYAFDANLLTTLTVPSTVTSVGEIAFGHNNFSGGVTWNANIVNVAQTYYSPFKGCTLASFTIGEGVANISNNLLSESVITAETINIPSSVTYIGSYSLYASGITSITIPSTVTSIGTRAFASNTLSGGVVWNSAINTAASWDYPVFESSNISDITFGSNLTKIPDNALSKSNVLSGTISFPSSVTTIGSRAFYGADLTNLTIPATVTTIGGYAFDSNLLTSLTVPSTVTSVSDVAFGHNNFSSGVNWNTNLASVGNIYYSPFQGATISTFNIAAGVTNLSSNLVAQSTITSGTITIPSSITTIGQYSFYGTGITNLTIPSTVSTISTRAFGSINLTSGLVWNANVASIASWDYPAFDNTTISSVTIGANVTMIPANFLSKAKLAAVSMTIPNNVTTIGAYAFYTSGLTNLNFTNYITTIGNYAFRYDNFTTVAIQNSTTNIGTYAFGNNAPLTTVTIDNISGAVSLGASAFGAITPTYLRP